MNCYFSEQFDISITAVYQSRVHPSAKRQIETSSLTATLDQLEQGTYYHFTIQPFYEVVPGSTYTGST